MFRCVHAVAGLIVLGGITAPARAQHSDVHFYYDQGALQIELESPGFLVFESTFPTSGIFTRTTSNPGFGSETDDGHGINPGDIVGYNVLAELVYWDGTSFASPGSANIVIANAAAPSTLVDGASGLQPGNVVGPDYLNIIGSADAGGEVHSHFAFTLSNGAALGAYGLVLSLSSSAPVDDSAPFGILFNYGLPPDQFEAGVRAFNALIVPEPSSVMLAVLGAALASVFTWRRQARRRSPS